MSEHIKHISTHPTLCGLHGYRACVNDHLGLDRYKQLGVKERFKDEPPYRICKRCLAIVAKREAQP